jgi:predicted DNA-binding transcriptional regulator AlpA
MDEADQLSSIMAGYVTPKRLAKALGVTERTIARWYHFREGPPRVKVGRKVFYRLESVNAWLESCEHPQARANRGERSRPSRNSRVRMSKELNKGPEAPE